MDSSTVPPGDQAEAEGNGDKRSRRPSAIHTVGSAQWDRTGRALTWRMYLARPEILAEDRGFLASQLPHTSMAYFASRKVPSKVGARGQSHFPRDRRALE